MVVSSHEENARKLVTKHNAMIHKAVEKKVEHSKGLSSASVKMVAQSTRKLAKVMREECSKEAKKIREAAKTLDSMARDKKKEEPKKKRGRKPKAAEPSA